MFAGHGDINTEASVMHTSPRQRSSHVGDRTPPPVHLHVEGFNPLSCVKWVSGSRGGETVWEAAAAAGQPPVRLRQILSVQACSDRSPTQPRSRWSPGGMEVVRREQ